VTLKLDFKVTGIGALDVLCAQLTRDLFAIAKFLLSNLAHRQTDKHRGQSYIPLPLSEVNKNRNHKTRNSKLTNLSADNTLIRSFYRAMLYKRGLCRHAVSVCPSVCHVRGLCQNE